MKGVIGSYFKFKELYPNTLDLNTPQIFQSKKLSGMVWKISKFSQNEQIYMFFVHLKSFYDQKGPKTCKFPHFDSTLKFSKPFPITFLIDIFGECSGQG